MITDWITATSTGVIALATASGVIVARMGLNTWKEQLKGTTEYDLARRLLLQLYKVRDAIGYVRNPFLLVSEAGEPKDTVPWEVAAYENRWKGVREGMIELEAIALECEVIWGKEVIQLKEKLTKQVISLNQAVGAYIRAASDIRFQKDFERLENILYARGEDDEFDKILTSVINEIEEYIKPRLKGKPGR